MRTGAHPTGGEDATTTNRSGRNGCLHQQLPNQGDPLAVDTREESAMNTLQIVSPQEWEAARQQLLVKEKELTRARDALAAERRRMPWQALDKDYVFDG